MQPCEPTTGTKSKSQTDSSSPGSYDPTEPPPASAVEAGQVTAPATAEVNLPSSAISHSGIRAELGQRPSARANRLTRSSVLALNAGKLGRGRSPRRTQTRSADLVHRVGVPELEHRFGSQLRGADLVLELGA